MIKKTLKKQTLRVAKQIGLPLKFSLLEEHSSQFV